MLQTCSWVCGRVMLGPGARVPQYDDLSTHSHLASFGMLFRRDKHASVPPRLCSFRPARGRGASTSSEESCERSPLCIVVVAIQPLTGLSHATTSKCWDRKERCLQATPLAFVPKTTSSEGFMTASIVTEAGILSWKLWASCRRVGFGGMWVASFAYLMWSRK